MISDEQWEGLCNALDAILNRIEDLEKKVNEEIMGGIRSLYDENCRHEDIEGLKGSYGEKYGPFAEDFGALSGGKDMWESLYDDIKDLAAEEREPAIVKIFDEFKAKLDKIRGIKADEKPSVEVTKVETAEPPAEQSMDDMIRETVGRLKKNGSRAAVKE
jgi:hypothetical protein